MTEQSIGEILNDDEPTAEAPVEATQPEEAPEPTETAQAIARDERGRFAPKGETDAPPASQEEPGHIPIAALKDERSKRQALEAELQQMRDYYAQQQAQPAQTPPDRWEDPDGYDQWLIAQATGQATRAAQEAATQQFETQRIQQSADQLKATKPDYTDKIGVFGQMAAANPALLEEMRRAPNPAQYAYDVATIQTELHQHGGLEGLIEARIAARNNAVQDVHSQLPSSLPPSISADRSVGARSGPAWSGPVPLSDLLS